MLADRYELDHEIGRGGMGLVWLGRDTVLGRTVAIKQLGMASGLPAPDLDRAEREARLAARVNHHNVVAVYDLVIEDGHQWLVMEHVDGPTLAGLIAERGALDPDELAPVLEQVAGALAAAHEHGIVHRDVKPSNILLSSDGVAKLSDFGVARAQADASLTRTGLVTGSPAYLSPEVATGRVATAASDVWSLGATMFHALAGRPPYEVGENLMGAMYRIVHDDPPRLADGGRLGTVVETMMQHDPDARPTMTEVERTVADLAEESGAADEPTATLDLDATQGLAPVTSTPEPAPTAAFRPVQAAVPDAVPEGRPPRAHDRLDVGRRALLLGGAAVAAVVAVLLFAVLSRGDDPTDGPRAGAGTSPSTSSSASPDAGAAPTTETLEGFAADYLTAASNDPEDGFAMLTPDYQQQSGGLDGYESFWGKVSGLDVHDLQADPDALTVSYRYSYEYGGNERTEDVTLQLEESGRSFLISGAV